MERLGTAVRTNGFDGTVPVHPIRMAVSSGHGIGKSTLVAWIVDWIMSTREHSRGTITANTFGQVKDKTWAAIQKWTPLCLTGHWFTITSERMSKHRVSGDLALLGPELSRGEQRGVCRPARGVVVVLHL